MSTTRPGRGAAPGWRSFTRLVAPVLALALVLAQQTAASAQGVPDETSSPGGRLALEALFERGEYEAAERALEDPGVPADVAAFLRARLAAARGRYDDALGLLRPLAAVAPDGPAALELGLLQLLLGRRSEAIATLEPLVDGRAAAQTPPELLRAGRAAHALGRFRIANALFRDAVGSGADAAAVNTAWGELLLEKHNIPEAIKSFEAALRADAGHAAAHLGLARALVDDDPPAAAARARQALAIDPMLADAHAVLAGLALDEGRRDAAREEIAAALRINPNHLQARSLRAALAYLEARRNEFDDEIGGVLAINPRYGEAYRITAAQVAAAYRFEEAAELAGRAVALDPDNVRARAGLGMHLLRSGDEAGARAALERAFADDPFDVVTFNLLSMLDTLEGFDTITDGDLVIRLHPEETPVMGGLVVALAREAISTLSARYGLTPRGPLLIEMFPRHDDFAVRNVGLPGMIGALGACFGRVVTLDSPRARPPGSFNWAATLWHELAHVFTLQLSDQRVPRWLTEGISVYEERRARGHWGREGDFAFLQAYARGGVLPLDSLNRGFSDPRAISLAYHQASLLTEHIVERFGEESLRAMLRAYGEGLDDQEVLARALRIDLAGLQASFDRDLERRLGAARDALRLPEDVAARVAAARGAEIEALAAAHPGKYEVQTALGRARLAAGDARGAMEAFERAVALVPGETGEESPGAWIARLREQEGDVTGSMEALDRVLAMDHTGVEHARALARLAAGASDAPRLRLAYGRLIEVLPLDAEPYVELGRLALGDGDGSRAVAEYQRALAAGPADIVAVRTELAESLLLTGLPQDARREVILALEQAPRYERAQELLLRIVDGDDGRVR